MAAITELTSIYSGIELDKEWKEITLGNNLHTAYFIAIKEEAANGDTINVDDVASILCEIAIESGIEGKEIVIRRFNLNFNENTSSDEAINKATAYVQLLNLPSSFKIRPVYINTKSATLEEGIVNIDINISPLDLGY